MNSLCLCLTYGMSLKDWHQAGLLDREIRIYNKFAEEGKRIAFFTYGDNSDLDFQCYVPKIQILPAYSKVRRPRNAWLARMHSCLLPWFWKRELSEYDIFKTNQMLGAWVACIASKIAVRNRTFVVRCGYEYHHFAVRRGVSWLKRTLIAFYSRAMYRFADHILLTTEEAKQYVVSHFGVSPTKVTVCPNLIDTDLFRPASTTQTENGRIVFVGRLSDQKNLFALVDACKIAQVGLDIFGRGELEQSLRKYINLCGADVRLMGTIPNERLPDVLNRYQVFVLPSKYEGNPKTLLEAMSCGKAVLGAAVDGIREIIASGQNGLLCGTDADSISKALCEYKKKPSLITQLGLSAREYVLSHCSIDRIKAIELGVYNAPG